MPIQSYISGLYASGAASGFYAPAGADPGADLTTWFARIQAGEPYGADARAIADEIHAHHQGFGLPGTPAPLLLHGGWTDDLFPSSEPLRIYNALRAANPSAPVSLQFADLGHQRGSNKVNADKALNDAGTRVPRRLPARRRLAARARQRDRVHPDLPAGRAGRRPVHGGELARAASRRGDASAPPPRRPSSSGGGDPATAQAYDPISGGGDACKSIASASEPGTAAVHGPPRRRLHADGPPDGDRRHRDDGRQRPARRAAVGRRPGRQQVLVSRAVYRLTDNQRGRATFQLSGNGYRFAAGHAPRLELLGRDAPYYRASNGSFSAMVANLRVELPVAERPGSVPGVGAPAARARPRPRLSVRVRLPSGASCAPRGA